MKRKFDLENETSCESNDSKNKITKRQKLNHFDLDLDLDHDHDFDRNFFDSNIYHSPLLQELKITKQNIDMSIAKETKFVLTNIVESEDESEAEDDSNESFTYEYADLPIEYQFKRQDRIINEKCLQNVVIHVIDWNSINLKHRNDFWQNYKLAEMELKRLGIDPYTLDMYDLVKEREYSLNVFRLTEVSNDDQHWLQQDAKNLLEQIKPGDIVDTKTGNRGDGMYFFNGSEFFESVGEYGYFWPTAVWSRIETHGMSAFPTSACSYFLIERGSRVAYRFGGSGKWKIHKWIVASGDVAKISQTLNDASHSSIPYPICELISKYFCKPKGYDVGNHDIGISDPRISLNNRDDEIIVNGVLYNATTINE